MSSTSAASPGETLRASPGKEKFTRIARLLICGGTRILREYFDSCHSPANLATFLKTPMVENHLQQLRKRKVLKLSQWKVLYPSPKTCGKSESFDITLLFLLIRELVVLTPPASGWDVLPPNSDLTLPADLARIKYYRNDVYAHGRDMELTDIEFDEYWEQLEGALLRIVKYYKGSVRTWQTAIDDLFKRPITEFQVLGRPEAELAMESAYFQNMNMCSILEENTREVKELRSIVEGKSLKEITFRCKLKAVTVGAVVVGTAYVFYRYKDDPEELRKMIKEALFPIGGLLVGTIALGSIEIGIQAESLEALEGLLARYQSGQLEKDLAKVFVTEELKNATNGEPITFSVEMNENDYRIAYCEMLREVSQREGEPSYLKRLQNIEKKSNLLHARLVTWTNGRLQVVKSLHDYEEELKKLKLTATFTKIKEIVDPLFWPGLVAIAAVFAYYLASGNWKITAAIFAIFATIVAILVAIFGAATLRTNFSFVLFMLFDSDFEIHVPLQQRCGKHSSSGVYVVDRYSWIGKEIKEQIQTGHAMVAREIDDVEALITNNREIRLVSNKWDADFVQLYDVRACLKDLKANVKSLKSSSNFGKSFQLEEIVDSMALNPKEFRQFVESQVESHHEDVSKVKRKIREMADDLEVNVNYLDNEKIHDLTEKYLDELFVCLTCNRHDESTGERTELVVEVIERICQECIELADSRQEVGRELTKLADKLNFHQSTQRNGKLLGIALIVIGGVLACLFSSIVALIFFVVGAAIRVVAKSCETKHLQKSCLDTQKSVDRNQELRKKLQTRIHSLKVLLSSINKDELEELHLKLADELRVTPRPQHEPRTLSKTIFWESIQTAKGFDKPFSSAGQSKSVRPPHVGQAVGATLGFVDISTFLASLLERRQDEAVPQLEKKIRNIVEQMPCINKERIIPMIKEYVTEILREGTKY